jgi:hypothetical protein
MRQRRGRVSHWRGAAAGAFVAGVMLVGTQLAVRTLHLPQEQPQAECSAVVIDIGKTGEPTFVATLDMGGQWHVTGLEQAGAALDMTEAHTLEGCLVRWLLANPKRVSVSVPTAADLMCPQHLIDFRAIAKRLVEADPGMRQCSPYLDGAQSQRGT